jgi:hypothetical protein
MKMKSINDSRGKSLGFVRMILPTIRSLHDNKSTPVCDFDTPQFHGSDQLCWNV